MTLWSESATAMAPMEAIFWSSNTGCQVLPALVLFHTPPATPPKYQVLGSPGTPVTATTRPPRNGPICRHFMAPKSCGSTWVAAAALHATAGSSSVQRTVPVHLSRQRIIWLLRDGE